MARKVKKMSPFKKFLLISVSLLCIQGLFLLFFGSGAEPVTVKEAISKAVRQQSDLPEDRREQMRVQLALADFKSKRSKYPASLDELVPEYFESLPIDPNTRRPFEYRLVSGRYTLGTAKPRVTPEDKGGGRGGAVEAVDPAVIAQLESDTERASFTYDPTGKRDPFQPFDFAPKTGDLEGRTPLEQYAIGQLRYTSYLGGSAEAIAIVENAAGKGFTVRKGAKIGTNGGVVVEIRPDKILVLEETVDFTGVKKSQTVEIALRTKGQDSKKR